MAGGSYESRDARQIIQPCSKRCVATSTAVSDDHGQPISPKASSIVPKTWPKPRIGSDRHGISRRGGSRLVPIQLTSPWSAVSAQWVVPSVKLARPLGDSRIAWHEL